MTPSLFKKRLLEHGFEYKSDPHGGRFSRVVSETKQHVARESIRGSAWRLHLAVGEIPSVWPALDVKASAESRWVGGESPWFTYATDLNPSDSLDAHCDSREIALEKSFGWLITIGFVWLNAPGARTPDEWRKNYNILVKHVAP